ncbi:shTK domain protein [Ancylostoma ceylanicum]|uniref:ShTK domain protein n=1 Tax=Ancylostoma ceylanicum TaxID=53326 RepID=A0A0D6LIW3_9BILA|nr:shTK domain protein [Ancylostoma ceylanicum]
MFAVEQKYGGKEKDTRRKTRLSYFIFTANKTSDAGECGTGKDSRCCDKEPSCAVWASYGECDENPNYMLSKCKLSCHACRTTFPKPKSQTCRDNGMTQEVRQMFLNMHNRYRSMVAKGEAIDGAGGYAPRAASMKKMVRTYSF